MRRCTVTEGIVHGRELFLHIFFPKTHHFKCFNHDLRIMISDRAGGEFHTVAYQVILIGCYCERIYLSALSLQQHIQTAGRHGERIMTEFQFTGFLADFIHRKIDDPAELISLFIHMSGHLGTQHLDHYAGGLLSLTAHTGGNTNQTAGLQSEALCQRFLQRIDKFRNASNKSPAFIHAEPVRLCSSLHFDICAELINLFSGHITAGNYDRLDCIAVSEVLEFGVFYQIRYILCSQVNAQVRLVASVCLQSIQILDPTERCGGSDIVFPILGKNRRQDIL